MENKRIYYAQKIEDELRQIQSYKKRTEDTLKRFQGIEAACGKITELTEKVAEFDVQIDAKTQEAQEIRSGLRDKDIQQRISTDNKEVERKKKETRRRKQEEKKDREKRKQESEDYYQKNRRSRYLERRRKRDMNYEYRRYMRNCDKIPDYMKRNLSNMPNNKGYIWRGIWLFGDKPADPRHSTVMFERKSRDILIIHEIDSYEHKIYEKKGKNRKILVKSIPRRNRRNKIRTRF